MDNTATVARIFELWSAGRIDDTRELLDPEIEWSEPPETIGRNIVVGPDAALAALANWTDQFESIRADTTELRGNRDRVLHALQQYARPRGSTAEIAADLYMVWWFRDGKATRMEMYNTRGQAEEAFAR